MGQTHSLSATGDGPDEWGVVKDPYVVDVSRGVLLDLSPGCGVEVVSGFVVLRNILPVRKRRQLPHEPCPQFRVVYPTEKIVTPFQKSDVNGVLQFPSFDSSPGVRRGRGLKTVPDLTGEGGTDQRRKSQLSGNRFSDPLRPLCRPVRRNQGTYVRREGFRRDRTTSFIGDVDQILVSPTVPFFGCPFGLAWGVGKGVGGKGEGKESMGCSSLCPYECNMVETEKTFLFYFLFHLNQSLLYPPSRSPFPCVCRLPPVPPPQVYVDLRRVHQRVLPRRKEFRQGLSSGPSSGTTFGWRPPHRPSPSWSISSWPSLSLGVAFQDYPTPRATPVTSGSGVYPGLVFVLRLPPVGSEDEILSGDIFRPTL